MLSYFPELKVSAKLSRANTTGDYSDGEYTPSTRTETDIEIIAPQPIRENDLNMLADGEKASDYRVTWVDADLDLATRQATREADIIIYDGTDYKVMQVDDRDPIGNFRRVVMRDMDGI